MSIYLIASTLVFLFFALIWKTNSWINVFCRVVLVGLGLFGFLLSLQSFGYIIKH